jgi:hypothetical protein
VYIDILNRGCGYISCTYGLLVSGWIHTHVNGKLEYVTLILMRMLIYQKMVEYILIWYNMIYLLTAIGLTLSGSSTVHIYTQTIQRTTQLTTLAGRLSGIRTNGGQTKINNELTA